MKIRLIDCAKDGAGDLDANWGWALQRQVGGYWLTIAWFRSREDVKEVVKFLNSYDKQS